MLTLKQQREAQKQAKKAKKLERELKESVKQKVNINQKTFHNPTPPSILMRRRIEALKERGDRVSEEDLQDIYQSNEDLINALVYSKENKQEALILLDVFNGQAEIISQLIQDFSPICSQDLKKAIELSRIELSIFKEWLAVDKDLEKSPNQKRHALAWTRQTMELAHIFRSALSSKTYGVIQTIATGYTVCKHYIMLYKNFANEVLVSLNKIINGMSIRELAKQSGIKENKLREQILEASKHYYILGVMHFGQTSIRIAQTIPDLRREYYQYPANYENLSYMLKKASEMMYLPMATYLGIDILNMKEFTRNLHLIGKKLVN